MPSTRAPMTGRAWAIASSIEIGNGSCRDASAKASQPASSFPTSVLGRCRMPSAAARPRISLPQAASRGSVGEPTSRNSTGMPRRAESSAASRNTSIPFRLAITPTVPTTSLSPPGSGGGSAGASQPSYTTVGREEPTVQDAAHDSETATTSSAARCASRAATGPFQPAVRISCRCRTTRAPAERATAASPMVMSELACTRAGPVSRTWRRNDRRYDGVVHSRRIGPGWTRSAARLNASGRQVPATSRPWATRWSNTALGLGAQNANLQPRASSTGTHRSSESVAPPKTSS